MRGGWRFGRRKMDPVGRLRVYDERKRILKEDKDRRAAESQGAGKTQARMTKENK